MALYETLRNAEIYETDGVTSNLHLAQDGIAHEVEGQAKRLHIDDSSGLRIYVPADKDDQDGAFAKALPERLFQWLMTIPVTNFSEASQAGTTAAMAIIATPRSKLTSALEDCGIMAIDVENVDEVAGQDSDSGEPVTTPTNVSDDSTTSSDSVPGEFDTPASSIETPQRSSAFVSEMNGVFSLPMHPRTSSDPFASPSRSPIPTRSMPTHTPFDDPNYVALLSMVIAAGRRDRIPTRSASSVSQNILTTRNGFDLDVRGATQFERDCKIGAAGELYVSSQSHCCTPHL